MGLISHVIAAGIGYYAGQPEGRRQLEKLRRQAVEYAHGPEAKRLRERGWDAAGEGALAVRSFAWRTLGRKDATSTGDIADTRGRVLWRRSHSGQTTPPGPVSPTPGGTVPDAATTSGPGSSGSPSTSPASPSATENRP
ncbi:hypothetical protein ACQPZA_35185 [Pseudonocardia xinjiangensis]|uniref:hypothetical protein n=1 Tax=Pseudonocardia xinjiangensis TaxID=75289 RepID=UPI003D92E06C